VPGPVFREELVSCCCPGGWAGPAVHRFRFGLGCLVYSGGLVQQASAGCYRAAAVRWRLLPCYLQEWLGAGSSTSTSPMAVDLRGAA